MAQAAADNLAGAEVRSDLHASGGHAAFECSKGRCAVGCRATHALARIADTIAIAVGLFRVDERGAVVVGVTDAIIVGVNTGAADGPFEDEDRVRLRVAVVGGPCAARCRELPGRILRGHEEIRIVVVPTGRFVDVVVVVRACDAERIVDKDPGVRRRVPMDRAIGEGRRVAGGKHADVPRV